MSPKCVFRVFQNLINQKRNRYSFKIQKHIFEYFALFVPEREGDTVIFGNKKLPMLVEFGLMI